MGNKSRSVISENKFADLMAKKVTDVETLAKVLHESGREAVLNNKVLKPDGAPIGQIKFKEWNEISEDAKEGRRIQVRYMQKEGYVFFKL
jgi:hypothetical protein